MEVKDTYIADGGQYVRELHRMADEADKFTRQTDQAAVAARRMGSEVSAGANKASRAESELERAGLKAAESQRMAGSAADKAADNFRQLARDAELAAAAERLGALKASGSVSQHNSMLKDLRKRYPELERDASGAFKLMSTASGTFGKALDGAASGMSNLSGMGRALPGIIIAGLELLPTAAAAAGGGITLALGGALSAIGIMAQAKSADIRNAFSDLRKHVTTEITRISAPFHDTLGHVAQDARTTFDALVPSLAGAFAKMAPAMTRFSGSLSKALSGDKVKGALDSLGTAFARVLDSLGSRMGPIMGNFASGLKAITDAVAANPTAFTGFVEGISRITKYMGEGIGFLIRYSHQFTTLFQTLNAFAVGPVAEALLGFVKMKDAISSSGGSFSGLVGSATQAGSALNSTGMATEDLLSSQKVATMTSDQLKAALDRLTGANQTAFDAQTQYANALNAANALAKKSNAGFDGNSKAIQANRAALSDLAQAFKNDLTGKTPAEIDKMRQSFINAAEGMGASKQRAKELADELLGVAGNVKKIPDKKDTKLGAKDNTKPGVDKAKKNTESFTDRIWKAQITAQNKVGAVVSAAAGAARRFAGAAYRASLTALNRTGGVISSAIGAARRFASGTYRASLTAANNAWSALNSALAAGRAWAGRVFTATFNVVKKLFAEGGSVEGYAEGGRVQHFPTGGQVHGPGTGTSDSIPIMVSNGEYVVNAKQAAKYRGLLDAINYGLDGYAKGGKVSIGKKEQRQIARLHAAQARVDLARARPEYLAAMAAQQALASMRSSVYGGIRRGGAAGIGSSAGTVVQHVNNVTVNVQGSVRADYDLAHTIANVIVQNRIPVVLPAGR